MGLGKILPVLLGAVFLLASCEFPSSDNQKLNQQRATEVSLKTTVPVDFIPRNIRIVSAGDSLTEGVGDSRNLGGYIPYLENLLEGDKSIKKASFSNYGKKGNRTDQLLERLKNPELKEAIKTADTVIVTIGGNDVMKVVRENLTHLTIDDFKPEMETYRDNLSEVIHLIRQENRECSIILVGLYNPFFQWFADLKEMNQIIYDWNISSQSILSQYDNTFFVDISELFLNSPENLLYTDYFHPNDRGYELIAEEVYEVIDQNILTALNTSERSVEEERHEE